MLRKEFEQVLTNYQTLHAEEQGFVPLFLKLLKEDRAFFRDHFPAHFTGSAWVIDEPREHVLLIHHAKLNRWLQPGGHADGTENLFEVARKELQEETGLTRWYSSAKLFDIDAHLIPARGNVPVHWHYDARYLFYCDPNIPLSKNAESHALKWIPLSEVEKYADGESSLLRMVWKTTREM